MSQLLDEEGKLIDKIKEASQKKTYKESGKKRQAVVIAKDHFLAILAESNSDLSDEILTLIEPTVCLT